MVSPPTNAFIQIVQPPGRMMITSEAMNEVRELKPGAPPASTPASPFPTLRGDAVSHWEGDTLVVETTNYHPLSGFNSYYCCSGAADHLRVVERFRRTDADTIDYRFTDAIADPAPVAEPAAQVEATKPEEPSSTQPQQEPHQASPASQASQQERHSAAVRPARRPCPSSSTPSSSQGPASCCRR